MPDHFCLRPLTGVEWPAQKDILPSLSAFAPRLSIATEASFLSVLRRFSSRRGTPAELWSDNATTFHGADVALRSMFKEARHDQQQIQTDLANQGIRWRFIPPAAPHFGGLWEAAVKSAKRHLKKVVGQCLLTYEEMSTLTAQVELCLNSRPLTPLTGDIEDIQH